MNAQPHTHTVKLHRWARCKNSKWVVEYGDQERTVSWFRFRFWGTDTDRFRRAVERATKKAVIKHDRESIKAGGREAVRRDAEEAARRISSTWVS